MKKINQNKYPLGYLPKIEYWTDQLIEGTKTGNEELIKKSNENIKYFLEKEKQRLSVNLAKLEKFEDFTEEFNAVYTGSINDSQLDWIRSCDCRGKYCMCYEI
mgnify:CR=1 FL=1|jgi:hypothetical protein